MNKNSPEQLDWLKDEDEKADDDERARLGAMYGEGASNAPINEKERKEARKKRKGEIDAMLAGLKKKLPEGPKRKD